MKLIPPPFKKFESQISVTRGKDKKLLLTAKLVAENYLNILDYIMTRFVEDFGDRLDTHTKRNVAYHKFQEVKSKQYAEATRFLRLVNFYETT